ncbi:MAG: Fe-S cluster assembly protein SufD, partial [Chitinophagales bacterium]
MSASSTLAAVNPEGRLANSWLNELIIELQRPASSEAWINALRADALDRLSGLTVPTKRDEAWRFTDISPLTKLSFEPQRSAIRLQTEDIEHFYLEEASTRLVFVDGAYAPQLSSIITADDVIVA